MAIPIKKYINIGSTVLGNTVGERDLSGLVFTDETMNATVPAEYSTIKTDYTAGKAVALSYNGINACFPSTSKIAKFAAKYFSYRTSTSTPKVLNVAKYTPTSSSGTAGDSEKSAYDSVVAEFTNFGSFTFLGANIANLVQVATAAKENKALCIIAVDDDEDSWPTEFKTEGVHCVIGKAESGVNYAAWMPMAWFASVNYDIENASGTMDYKEFGAEVATITTGEAKDTADAARMNYIGQVQIYGAQRKFYQKGVNGDGVDIGVYRDKVWLESEIEIGWFNLVGGTNKIPANDGGVAQVYGMIVSAAENAITSGIILRDKPLSATALQQIATYTTDPKAIEAVQTLGYFVAAKLVQDGDTYAVQYLLIYAKGDHIGKVEGSHVIV